MSWITAGSTSLTNGGTNYGTVSLQYDDSSSGSDWSCRLYFSVNSSVTSLSVYFNNLTIAGVNHGQYSVTKNTTTIWTGSLGGNQTVGVSWTCPWYSGSKNYSFNASLPSKGTLPTGLKAEWVSSTWNTVNIKSSVTSWGTYTGTPEIQQIVVDSSATASNWETKGRQVRSAWTTSTSSTQGVTTANSTPYSGGITIKGAMPFKVAAWAINSAGTYPGGYINANTTYYTPPAEIASFTYTQTGTTSGVSVAMSITGSDSSKNYGNSVTTQYCYSTNGGSSYTSWTSISGTASPWTTKKATITVPYKSSVVIKARQVYGGQASTEASKSFTAIGSNPSGLSVSVGSITYNSIAATSKVTNWGTGAGSNSMKTVVTTQSYTSDSLAQRYKSTTSTSQTVTINNSSSTLNGGITIKGAGTYYVGTYATNGGLSSLVSSSAVYTPPATPASITYTQTPGSTNVAISATITGADSNSNNGNTVTTYYQYSTDGGSTYSAWTSAGTGAATGSKTVSFTVPYAKNVVIRAKQTYQSKDSDIKSVSFASNAGTAPSNLTLSIDGSTWNSITLSGSCSYENPSSISGRYICLGVNTNGTSLAGRTEIGYSNSASGSGTVNNSSTKKDGGVDLKGMLPVYPYIYANNTVKSAVFIDTVYYLPPAPGSLTYSTAASGTDIECTLNYVGVAANNYDSYTAADLTRTVRYKGDQDADWTYVENGTQIALTTATTETITIAAAHNAVIEAWMTYDGKDSEHSSITVVNSNDPVHLYASVNNETTKVIKLYGSVNNETVKIKKLYASVNGVARKVFEDAS